MYMTTTKEESLINSLKESKAKLKRINQKLVAAEKKLSKSAEYIKELKQEQRKLRSRIRGLLKSRKKLREKYKAKQQQIKGLKAKVGRAGKAKWHHYTT